MQRSVALGYAGQVWARIAMAGLALGAVTGVFVDTIVDQTSGWTSPLRMNELIAPAIAGGVVAAILALALFWLRNPSPARLSWDDEGITEWENGAPRVAIPWSIARRSGIQLVGKHGGFRGQILQIWDGASRRITVSNAIRQPIWLMRRKAVAHRTEQLVFPPDLPAADGVQSDDSRRPLGWLVWPQRIGYAAFAGLVGLSIDQRHLPAVDEAFVIAPTVSLLLALRMLRPASELVRILREGAAMRGARRVELVANEGTVLEARDEKDERPVRFDTAQLQHPDGLLHTRRGPVWIVGEAEPGDPYRGSAHLRVTALEHDGARGARRMRIRGVVAELVARAAVAMIPLLLIPAAVAWAMGDPYGYGGP